MSRPLLGLLLRRHRLTVGLCSLVPVILGVVVGFIYPTFAKERALARMFTSLTNFLGQGQLDMISPRGAFTLTFQHPFLLVIFAAVVAIPATGLPAGERGRKALDLLCATPLSRAGVMGTVTAVVALAAALMGVTGYLGAFLAAAIAGELGSDIPWGAVAAVALNAVALCWALGGGALLASACAPDRPTAATWYGSSVVVFFIIDVTARMWKEGEWLTWFTPYGYHRPAKTVALTGSMQHAFIDSACLVGLAAALTLAAFAVAGRRRSV